MREEGGRREKKGESDGGRGRKRKRTNVCPGFIEMKEDVLKANQRDSYYKQRGHRFPTGRLCRLGLISGDQQLARMPRALLSKHSP